jgi:HNH endonuclease
MPGQTIEPSPRKQSAARKAASAAYPFRCCVICGLQIEASLTVAHLDHHAGNNDPDNLAYLCGTHHWMYDCGLYPISAIKLLRAHWQETKGVPDHKPRMKDAGAKAARKRDYLRRGKQAAETREHRKTAAALPKSLADDAPNTTAASDRSAAAREAWLTRRASAESSARGPTGRPGRAILRAARRPNKPLERGVC